MVNDILNHKAGLRIRQLVAWISMSKRSSVSQSRGQRGSMVVENVKPISSTLGTQLSMQFPAKSPNYKSYPLKENYRTLPLQGQLNSESHLSRQFGNGKEMAKELDTLLQCIKRPSGFRDACTIFQRSSVIELEQGIDTGTLSEKLLNVVDHNWSIAWGDSSSAWWDSASFWQGKHTCKELIGKPLIAEYLYL